MREEEATDQFTDIVEVKRGWFVVAYMMEVHIANTKRVKNQSPPPCLPLLGPEKELAQLK